MRAQPEASSSQAPAGDPLEEAEAAYLDVDFDRTLASATHGAVRGGNGLRRRLPEWRLRQLLRAGVPERGGLPR